MSRVVAISQRVDVIKMRAERRDALDQRWSPLLERCDLMELRIPNQVDRARALIEAVKPIGVILTGGNDLAAFGGEAPERDATEAMLIDWARDGGRPLFAVCRGLQMLMHHCGAKLSRVVGHTGTRHLIEGESGRQELTPTTTGDFNVAPAGFSVLARASDGTIEAVRHEQAPIHGIMWHPERETPVRDADITLICALFGERP